MGSISSVLDCQQPRSSSSVDDFFSPGSPGPEAGGGLAGVSEIVFLGTGSSAGTPMISCCTNPESECVACRSAIKDGWRTKNMRGNPSLLIRYRGEADTASAVQGDTSGHRNIIIDCGKTFKSSVLRIFPGLKERRVDALVITHGLLAPTTPRSPESLEPHVITIQNCYASICVGPDTQSLVRERLNLGKSLSNPRILFCPPPTGSTNNRHEHERTS